MPNHTIAIETPRGHVVGQFRSRSIPNPSQIYVPKQVHGEKTIWIDDLDSEIVPADGVATTNTRQTIGIQTADCFPVLLWSPSGEAIAALHVGWRGFVRGVIREFSRTSKIRGWNAAIGPGIGHCCFEVGEDVFEEIAASAPNVDHSQGRTGHFVDLRASILQQLQCEGILSLLEPFGCTACASQDSDFLYESFRRDGAAASRHVHSITLEPTAP